MEQVTDERVEETARTATDDRGSIAWCSAMDCARSWVRELGADEQYLSVDDISGDTTVTASGAKVQGWDRGQLVRAGPCQRVEEAAWAENMAALLRRGVNVDCGVDARDLSTKYGGTARFDRIASSSRLRSRSALVPPSLRSCCRMSARPSPQRAGRSATARGAAAVFNPAGRRT